VWGEDWNGVNLELPKWDGVVAINCPHVTTARLEAAGYTYARRFAVLPSLEKARWFVSLDSGRAAMASFSVYTPSRTSAKIKKTVRADARAVARAGVVPGRGDRRVARDAADRKEARRVVSGRGDSAGAVVGRSGAGDQPQAVGGGDRSARSGAGVREDVRVARLAADRRARGGDAGGAGGFAARAVARPAADFRRRGRRPLRHRSVAPRRLAGAVATTRSHEAFLHSLRSQTRKPASETNMVATMAARIDALQPRRPDLREIFDAFLPALEQTSVPSTVVHGDFAPWNLRSHLGQIAAFDWEYGEIDGLPVVDQTHYALQIGYTMQKWTPEQAIGVLDEIAAQRPTELDPEQVTAIHAIYLLDQLARLLGEGYAADHEMVSWYGRILRGLKKPEPTTTPAAEVAAA
jgi:hypothetical protein